MDRNRASTASLAAATWVAFLGASLSPTTADAAAWQSIGPAPPAIEAAIMADPASRTIYVASAGDGVLKSTNGGASFAAVNAGLDALTITAMAMEPGNPDVVYVSTLSDVYKTTDGGASWHPTRGNPGVVVLAMDPTNPQVLYSGSSPNGGVAKTTDGGRTWQPATNGMGVPAVFSIAVDPHDPLVVYAGTAGAGAYRSADGGASWTPLQIDTTVWSVLVDPEHGDLVYAGTNGQGVYVSKDGGTTFAKAGSPDVGVVLSLVRSGTRLYAATATGGVSVSRDGGATWHDTGVAQGLGLVLSVDEAGTVYLGTNFEGAFMHRAMPVRDGAGNFGENNWRPLALQELRARPGQNGHALAVDPADHRRVFLSTNDGGLLVTMDGGRTWRDGGVHGLTSRAPRGIAFDTQDPRHVYTGGFTGMGFFRSQDGGRHWELRPFGPPLIYTTGVSVDPADHAVYVMTLSGHGVWKSTDFGTTFTRVDRAPGAPQGTFLGLGGRGVTVDPGRPGVVYAAASRGASRGIWRSMDAGASWVRVDASQVLSITVDPTDSNVVYAATPAPARVLKSTDGGATFAEKSAGLPAGFQTARTGNVLVDPQWPNVLYVGTEGAGVYKSRDAGDSWQPVNDGLDDLNVFGLALDPEAPGTVYVATARSVFRTTTGGE